MQGHVCRQHAVDHERAYALEVIRVKLESPIIFRVAEHHLKARSDVVILQDTLIVVPSGDRVLDPLQKDVINAWVLEVMYCRRGENSQVLIRVKIENLAEAASGQKEVQRLAEVTAVRLVVVGYVLVACLDPGDKVQHLLGVHRRVEYAFSLGKDVGECRLHLSTVGELSHFEDIEVV